MRIGLIGTGRIGLSHAAALADRPEVADVRAEGHGRDGGEHTRADHDDSAEVADVPGHTCRSSACPLRVGMGASWLRRRRVPVGADPQLAPEMGNGSHGTRDARARSLMGDAKERKLIA
jgi:hypothetical protein